MAFETSYNLSGLVTTKEKKYNSKDQIMKVTHTKTIMYTMPYQSPYVTSLLLFLYLYMFESDMSFIVSTYILL